MKMLLYILSVYAFSCCTNCESIKKTQFYKKIELGYFGDSNISYTSRSRISCAVSCSYTVDCLAISYSKSLHLCQLSYDTTLFVVDSHWISMYISDEYLPQETTSRAASHQHSSTINIHSSFSTSDGMTLYPPQSSSQETDVTLDHSVSTTDQEVFMMSTKNIYITTTPQPNPPTCLQGYTLTPSGRCLFISLWYYSYSVSSQRCVTHGGRLATIMSQNQNYEVINMLNARSDLTRGVFIGARDDITEGTWVWDTGENMGYDDWLNGAPSNFHADADCVAYSRNNNWKWRDVICSREYFFLCESTPI